MGKLDETGERMHIPIRPRSVDELCHVARYKWAAGQVKGRVLDVASGTGYGSATLSSVATVVGADLEYEAIAFGRRTTGEPRLACQARLPALPFSGGAFDAVVSFETIEHVNEDLAFVQEIRRVLRDDGVLLLSTPNRLVTSPGGVIRNPFHVREYILPELVSLLRTAGFSRLELFAQSQRRDALLNRQVRRVVGRFNLWRPGSPWDNVARGSQRVRELDESATPLIYVLRCS